MRQVSMATRDEATAVLIGRYAGSTRRDRGRILDELVAITGHHRKHVARMLRGGTVTTPTGPRPSRRTYDDAVRQALVLAWEAADRICGKRLKELLPLLLDAMDRHGHLAVDTAVRFRWGYTWTKTFLHSKGLLEKPVRRGAHRRKRPRRPLAGVMLHQDGSQHEWLADRPALDLIVTLDDATGAIYSAFLVEEEGTGSTFRALEEVFGHHGLPLSLYTDRGSHYFHTPEAGGKVNRTCLTQVGRALAHLGRRAYPGLLAAGAGTLGARFPHPAGPADQRTGAPWDHNDRGRRCLPSGRLHPGPQCANPSRRAAPSWRSPGPLSARSSACRRSDRSATIIACRSTV